MRHQPHLALALLALTVVATSGIAAQEDAPAPPAAEAEPEAEARPVKQIKMYAESWKWTPSTIRVTEGSLVRIHFVSRDASHAFELKDYGVEVPLPQDTTADVEFVVDRVGTFKWKCSRPCGNGCAKMRGKLIVEPAGE